MGGDDGPAIEMPRRRPAHALVTGARRSGKTALFRHLAGLPFDPAAGSVPGVDFCRLTPQLYLWDCNGAPHHRRRYDAELHVADGRRVQARRGALDEPVGAAAPGSWPPSEACTEALLRLLQGCV